MLIVLEALDSHAEYGKPSLLSKDLICYLVSTVWYHAHAYICLQNITIIDYYNIILNYDYYYISFYFWMPWKSVIVTFGVCRVKLWYTTNFNYTSSINTVWKKLLFYLLFTTTTISFSFLFLRIDLRTYQFFTSHHCISNNLA